MAPADLSLLCRENRLDQEFVQILTATDSELSANSIARVLVERRLVGCAQVVGPATSTYIWKGKVEVAQEWLCLMKTRADLVGAVNEAVDEMHPYDVPELIAMPVMGGNRAYLNWLGGTVLTADRKL